MVIPPCLLLRPPRDLAPFDATELRELDWSGIDLAVESQGVARRSDSIQARMISHVAALASWDVVLDDDGSGEVADIVALRAEGGELVVHMTHCKYVSGGRPRARVGDLYEVCGQAQKSARWRRSIPDLFERLIRRERTRVANGRPSGFIVGDLPSLFRLADNAHILRPTYTIAISQPGVSKAAVTAAQLELLASTETYLHETAYARLEVYCSA